MTSVETNTPGDLQLFTSEEFWARGSDARSDVFRRLRDEAPVCFMEEPEIPNFETGPGFWSVTRHEDLMHVSRHPDLFCSGKGTNIPDLPIDIAAQLPLQIICEMMGIPRDSWERIFELTNVILGAGDPELTPDMETLMAAVMEMTQIALAVGEDRRANPTDDLVSAMMHAEVDGEHLEPMEMASFFILLSAAGNETTRNAISHGILQLTRHEEQREIWASDVETITPTAIEEIVRWATPVVHFRRTATADTEVGGVPIAEGDKVVMWYESANRDERVIEDPFTFDVRRTPNEHVGFGAGGPHFCLGANLARREIGVMFSELFRWLPDIRTSSEPDHLQSSFIHGIKRMRCEFTPGVVDPLED